MTYLRSHGEDIDQVVGHHIKRIARLHYARQGEQKIIKLSSDVNELRAFLEENDHGL